MTTWFSIACLSGKAYYTKYKDFEEIPTLSLIKKDCSRVFPTEKIGNFHSEHKVPWFPFLPLLISCSLLKVSAKKKKNCPPPKNPKLKKILIKDQS